jgi:hypothetical protein
METAASNETTTTATTSNGVGGPSSSSSSSSPSFVKDPLYLQYPVGSTWDFTLSTEEKVIGATVYCTDEVSETVMIQKALTHTTLATEVRIVQASHIVLATKCGDGDVAEATTGSSSNNNNRAAGLGGGESSSSADVMSSFLSQPLPKIQKKALEERERRAVRLAEESFRHINQKVRVIVFYMFFPLGYGTCSSKHPLVCYYDHSFSLIYMIMSIFVTRITL